MRNVTLANRVISFYFVNENISWHYAEIYIDTFKLM